MAEFKYETPDKPIEIKGSERFAFSVDDLKKVGMGLVVVMVGAGLTYAAEFVSSTDFGEYGPVIVVVLTTAINFARKWLTKTERIEQKL